MPSSKIVLSPGRRRIAVLVTLLPLLCGGKTANADGGADAVAVLRTLQAQDRAVAEVGERLAAAAAPWCPSKGWTSDLTVQTLAEYGPTYRAAARSVLGIGDYPTVTWVSRGGAAERAGVRPGDQLLAIDGLAMAPSAGGPARMTDSARAMALIDRAMEDGAGAFTILRNDERLSLAVQGRLACRISFEVRAGSGGNASASPDRVQVSSDLVDPARAAEDLAPLLAHEVAHVILGHPDRLRGRNGGLLPGFGKHGAALRESEIAADRLSVYLLARAGYRMDDAVAFWSNFGRRTDRGLLSDRTHPGWRARVAAIRQEVDRVAALRATGAAIEPPGDLLPVRSR